MIDAGEHAFVHEGLEQFFGADVEFFGEFADGDAFGDDDCARLALDRRGHDFGLRGAACADSGTRANGVELALAFGETLFDERTATGGRGLTRVERLAGLGFAGWRGASCWLGSGAG